MTSSRKTQFQKGQSGNPNGRPKGSRSRWSSSYAETILKAGDRVITVTENGRPVRMTLQEAILRAEQSAALKGSPMAQRHLIDTYLKADAERRQEIAEECEHWEEIRNKLIRLRAEAEKAGRPPSIPFPHPDDIVIDPDTGVRFVGPIDEKEQAKLEIAIRMRDLLLVQDHFDLRQFEPSDRTDPEEAAGTAILLVHMLNNALPARYQLSTFDMARKLMALDRMTKRQLQTMLFQGWKAQGIAVPRARTFGSLRKGKEILTLIYEALDAQGSDRA